MTEPSAKASLRAEAENRAQGRPLKIEDLSPADVSRLVNELQVHQIELELQNEELVRAHADLERARDLYLNLFNLAPIGYVTLDLHGVVRETNKTFLDMLDATPDEVLNRHFASFVHPDDADVFRLRFAPFFKRPKGKTITLRLAKRGGDECPLVQLEGRLVDWNVRFGVERPQDPQLLLNVVDITARRKLEEELFNTQKLEALGTLAGGVAHDFNNLLTGILGYASHLTHTLPSESVEHEAARTIEQAALRAAALTNQLLGYARRGKFQVVPVDPHRLVGEAVSILSRTIDRNIRIETRLAAGDAAVKGDPGQLLQVVMNLTLNAVDAMQPGGGTLTIETALAGADEAAAATVPAEASGQYVSLRVSDTGHGIAPQLLHRLFEPFYTTKPPGKGTGMGLAMVYGIVRNHEGGINVESAPGKGAEFTLYLPLDSRRPAPQPEPRAAEAAHETGTILLIEDEEVVRSMVAYYLRSVGFEVLLAENGREAIDVYARQAERIDVVIVDMIMPVMGGRDCYLNLRAINPKVRAVLSSGYGLDDNVQALLDDGVQAWLQKPYQFETLLETLRRVRAG